MQYLPNNSFRNTGEIPCLYDTTSAFLFDAVLLSLKQNNDVFFYLQSFTTESKKFQSSNKRYIFHLLASLFASNYCLRVCVLFVFFCIAISELILFIAICDERLLWALAVNLVILRENFANKYFKFLVPAFCWEKNSILVQLRIGSRHYQLGSFQIRPLVWWIP